jgi:hypothetical protein
MQSKACGLRNKMECSTQLKRIAQKYALASRIQLAQATTIQPWNAAFASHVFLVANSAICRLVPTDSVLSVYGSISSLESTEAMWM